MIGIGAGDPDYVTAQAVAALNDTQVIFAMDKGSEKSDLVALRRQVCERFIREPGYRFVELRDPERARAAPGSPAYRSGRRLAYARRPRGPTRNPSWNPAVSAPSWHGATCRSTTARCESGTSSPPASTSTTTSSPASAIRRTAHRIPLNDAGEPVLVTTGRQLRDYGLSGSAVVMLDGDCSFRNCPPQTRIWWGAYLGTPDELLVSGTVGEVGSRIAELRADARARHGWIMDTYLLRPAD